MIPQKLTIKNFLSYGSEQQTIDFEPYHLICLSGRNGHGKSALLDAMTWALWGQARKIVGAVKADNGLLRLGQTHMMVIFDFILQNTLYRVRREFTQSAQKSFADLQFGVINPTTNQFVPLTDKTIRDTQEIIDQTLKLDFDTFINSAFLRQGQSNEFSKKSPKERKDILSSILGLAQFDLLRKKALAQCNKAETELYSLHILQERLASQIKDKELLFSQITFLKNELTSLSHSIETLAKQYGALQSQHQTCSIKQKEYSKAQQEYEIISHESNELKTALQKAVQQWRTLHRQSLVTKDVKQLEKQKLELLENISSAQVKMQQQLQVKEEMLHVKMAIQNKTHELQRHHEREIEKMNVVVEQMQQTLELTNKSIANNSAELGQKETLLKNRLEATDRIQNEKNSLLLLEQTIASLELIFEKRKNYYHQFTTQGSWITTEMQNIDQKIELMHAQDPCCPLCEQNLSTARRRFLKQKFMKLKDFNKHQCNRLAYVVKKLKPILVEQHEALQKLKKQREEKKLLIVQESIINEEIVLCKEALLLARKDLLHAQKEKEILEQKKQSLEQELLIKQKNYGQSLAENKELATLNTQLLQLQQEEQKFASYSREMQKLQEQLSVVDLQISLSSNMHTLQQNKETLNLSVQTMCSKMRAIKQRLNTLEKEINEKRSVQEQLNQLEKHMNESVEEQKRHIHKKEELLLHLGSLEQHLVQIQKIEHEQAQLTIKVNELNTVKDDYTTIARAVGKDGIQALLIEHAIPEIEQEANNLLSKLTNNQAQLFIESLRDLKKGGTKETLDIKISDSSGIRPYELFSGGEAFRIDFALRIAISKLLARRAGTALQTLIIDEGFGSQDDEGLSHIMDCLYKIQDDFAKVIIVSHLPTMKDQFPVHFMIEKGTLGSKVHVFEQG